MKMLWLLAVLPCLALGAAGSPDASFYKSLAAGGLAEVDLGKLAAEKASNQSVKDFGSRMVKDHSAADEELKSLADSKHVSLPSSPGTAAHTKKAELEVLSGEHFDKSYVSNQVKAHQQTVALLKKEIASGSDPDARAFAQKVLPTIESHLKAADQLADTLGVKH